MKYTKEPWKFSKSAMGGFYCQGNINSESIEIVFDCEDIKQSDADRIEDCVNSCEGINPKAVPDLLEACKYAIEQLKGVKGKTFPISPILNAIQKAEEK